MLDKIAYKLRKAVDPKFAAEAAEIEKANEERRKYTERGRQSEGKILGKLGEEKNTDKVSSDEGNSIPDYINDDEIGEIKDTKSVYDTKQIRIQRKAAEEQGKEHVIQAGTNAHVSDNVKKNGSKVVRHDELGPQKRGNDQERGNE